MQGFVPKRKKECKKAKYFVGRTCDQRGERRIKLRNDTGDIWSTESLGTTEWRESEGQRGKLFAENNSTRGRPEVLRGTSGNKLAFLGLLFLQINNYCAYLIGQGKKAGPIFPFSA